MPNESSPREFLHRRKSKREVQMNAIFDFDEKNLTASDK